VWYARELEAWRWVDGVWLGFVRYTRAPLMAYLDRVPAEDLRPDAIQPPQDDPVR
jgi:hypothetical protein